MSTFLSVIYCFRKLKIQKYDILSQESSMNMNMNL